MTLAQAINLVRTYELRLIKRDDEYIVKFPGCPVDDPRTYFTNDLHDAVHTAWLMNGRNVGGASPPTD